MPISGKEMVKVLKTHGWILARIHGSHWILYKDGHHITVPVHGNQSLKKGTEQSILKKAGLKR